MISIQQWAQAYAYLCLLLTLPDAATLPAKKSLSAKVLESLKFLKTG